MGSTLVWLRNDLRISDNPALDAAIRRGAPVVAVYAEERGTGLRERGAASRWWLNRSLNRLGVDLAKLGIALETVAGPVEEAITRLKPGAVLWNRRYGPAEREVDTVVKTTLKAAGVEAQSFVGNVLLEPFDIATKAGTPHGVFTPFWNALRQRDIAAPLPRPKRAGTAIGAGVLDAEYRVPLWAAKMEPHCTPGESAAQERLLGFLDRVAGYPEGRDLPGQEATSGLSPYLAFGEISARQIWHAAQALAQRQPAVAAAVDKFLSELAWRDFNIHNLYHRPDIATVSMQAKFEGMDWRDAPDDLAAWQRGETGIPIVDAGMRELWETGIMHNRVRMIVASFLTKNLLIDWRLGEQWFWDTLVDADPANNPGNWQWVAGCGTDAAPYFRIFNPHTQAERFDPDGVYVKRWAPEAREPIVDLKASRERALEAYAALT